MSLSTTVFDYPQNHQKNPFSFLHKLAGRKRDKKHPALLLDPHFTMSDFRAAQRAVGMNFFPTP